jgi:hypothetical protein
MRTKSLLSTVARLVLPSPEMRALRTGLVVTIAAGVCFASTSARAEEPVAASEPRLMSETAEITSVVDAFDKDDPFDLHLLVGFSQMWKTANIRRETALFQPGLTTGGFVARTENIAKYNQSTSTLNVGADIGIFKDFALVIRLPIILSDSRSMGDLDGSSNNPQRIQDPMGAQLFKVPFNSPTRSGVDWFSAGLDWAIFNQQRDFTKPTWVVGVEGRFGIGPSMHACNADAPQGTPQCPDPVNPSVNRDPGISRGMNSIGAHTIFSKRYGYVEPYTGFNFLAEFAQDRGDFGATNNLNGALVNHPPLLGTFTLGLEIIPYEHREQFQRLIADFRVMGTYHSPGREYSELFDALGSSQAPSLRQPNPTGYMHNPQFDPKNPLAQPVSIVDPQAQKTYFTGITDQQAFGSVSAHAAATWQAGEYIKFQAGLGFTFNQSHLVTSADACNPNFSDNIDKSGPCHTTGAVAGTPTGIPNPNHRAVIDLPGRRFSVDDTMIVNLWVSGVVMF